MKRFLFLFVLFTINCEKSKKINPDSTLAVEQTIHTFFKGFHAKDSNLIQSTTHNTFSLGSVFKTKAGVKFQTTDGKKFIEAVSSRPDKPEWKEILGPIKVNISGSLANAWVPYEFWLDNNLSHCGVNNINLMNTKEGWKILNITDSRLKICK